MIKFKPKPEKLMKPMFNTLNLIPGDFVKIVAKASSHNVPMGTILEYSHDYPGQPGTGFYCKNQACWFAWTDGVKIDKTIKHLTAELKEAEKKYNELLMKIEFMNCNKLTTLNEKQFKVFSILKTLESSNVTTLEKATRISALI